MKIDCLFPQFTRLIIFINLHAFITKLTCKRGGHMVYTEVTLDI